MKRTLPRALGVLFVIVGFAIVPVFFGPESYVLRQLEDVLSLVLVAIGLNIVTGYAGQLSLGPSAVFAVAGYAAAILANQFPLRMGLPIMCLAATAAAMVAGFILGIPALRVGGFYLAMITLFAALIVPVIAGNLSITGGSTGISLISNPLFVQQPSGTVLYELCVVAVLVLTLASWALLHSRVGHRFIVLRTSEELASSLGISPQRSKLLAFVLSSIPAGLGGAFYVYTQQFIAPGSVTTTLSIYLLAACVVGGFGTVMGPLLGGTLILSLSQFLGGFAEYQGVIFGVLLLVFAIGLPQGLMGLRKGVGGNAVLLRALPASLRRRGILTPPDRHITADILSETTKDAIERDVATLLGHDESTVTAAQDALILRDVHRSFGGVAAVDGVSLTVSRATIHGLVGSNGSGKTTILNLISGYYRLEGGVICIGDQPLHHVGHRAARAGVARTFQTPKLVPELSVIDNVIPASERTYRAYDISSFLRLPHARSVDKGARKKAALSLEALGLADVADIEASELPHGLRRLVEIARALALRPKFLLLDEPAAGLSEEELERLETVLQAIRRAGVGILLIEHNVPFVLRLADVVTVLHLGRVIAQGDPSVVLNEQGVAEAFLGSDWGSERQKPSSLPGQSSLFAGNG